MGISKIEVGVYLVDDLMYEFGKVGKEEVLKLKTEVQVYQPFKIRFSNVIG